MKLDQAIKRKTEGEISEIFLKENETLKPNILYYNINPLYYSINPIRHPFAYYILRYKVKRDKDFKDSLIKIKLNWYKRNLALLEILAGKQNLPDSQRLVFKIVRENINQNPILEDTDISHWYTTFTIWRLTKRLIRGIFHDRYKKIC